jgi:hypothetical protein
LLAIHFGNCGLAFLLFRRLGVSVPLSIAGVGLFGSLSTTAQTATYIGASFDVICLFFLLASTLALLWERRGESRPGREADSARTAAHSPELGQCSEFCRGLLSAVLFLAALRTKEFAIFAPLPLTVLLALRLPRLPLGPALAALARRLWMHYLILMAFGLRYLSLIPGYRTAITPDNPYYMDLHAATALKSLAWYTALVFGADESRWQLPPLLLALLLAALLCWAIFRRRAGIAFGVCAFVLTLQPVCLMPNQRWPFYAYAPQLFLILVLCLLAGEALASLGKRERLRWVVAVCIALACFSWCVAFRRRAYFRDRVNLTLAFRRTCLRTARDVDAQLPPLGPGTHVYVNHRRDTRPWLFLVGPCSYLRLMNRQRGIDCVWDLPTGRLRGLYAADRGEKYFVDYHDDGSITVTAGTRRQPR